MPDDTADPRPPQGHDVIVVGASMGGLDALRALVGGLPPDLPAAVFVVQHTAANGPGLLGGILDRAGPLPARLAEDGDAVQPGRIYVAPPDRHLLLTPAGVRLSRGPRENRTRPAADPLFRSAAVAYRSRVVGVVLSGLHDDGAAGLLAVTRCGGLAVVQDPADAAYPEMPRSALAAVADARVVPVAELGALLGRLAETPAGEPPPVPRTLRLEAQLTETGMDEIDVMDELGERTPLTCPDCGGVLWEVNGPERPRYRCHTGHAFTEAALVDGQAEATEVALMTALRTMEERARLLRKMDREEGRSAYAERAGELERHAERVRDLLFRARTHTPDAARDSGRGVERPSA